MTTSRTQEPTGTGVRLFAILITVIIVLIQAGTGFSGLRLWKALDDMSVDVRTNIEARLKGPRFTADDGAKLEASISKLHDVCVALERRVTLNEQKLSTLPSKELTSSVTEVKSDVKEMRKAVQANHDELVEIRAALKRLNGNSP